MVIAITFENCHKVAKHIVDLDRELALGLALELIAQLSGGREECLSSVRPIAITNELSDVQGLVENITTKEEPC
jgi:hypothetical protein